ncbi:MAG: DUF2786 domain-containing protein [Candidatus Limnocylindrales bacterium]
MPENERPNEGRVAKIRKILTKTEDAGCTQEEAEAAFALATRLMAEHNLEMSDQGPARLRSGSGEPVPHSPA